jgi:hypothetical protein
MPAPELQAMTGQLKRIASAIDEATRVRDERALAGGTNAS